MRLMNQKAHLAVLEERLSKGDGKGVGHADLNAVLASVAATGDTAGGLAGVGADLDHGRVHELELGKIGVSESLEGRHGLGALKSPERNILKDIKGDVLALGLGVRQVRAKVDKVLLGAAGISDNVQILLVAGNHL